MEALHTVGEILEFAIARELDSSGLYFQIAAQAEDDVEIRELFEELGKMELRHKAALELELMKTGLISRTEGKSLRVEMVNYMAGGHIKPGVGRKEVLMLAIKKEKASFRFYVDLVGKFDEEGPKETLTALAEEEARHVVRFEIEYDKVVGGGQ